MTSFSHAPVVSSSAVGAVPAANPVPLASSRCTQVRVGSEPGTPSLFHTSHGVPSVSTKGCGSIDPFGSPCTSHTSGPAVLSANGPSGDPDVSTVMQKRSRAVDTRTAWNTTHCPPIFAAPGAHTSFFSRPPTLRVTPQLAGWGSPSLKNGSLTPHGAPEYDGRAVQCTRSVDDMIGRYAPPVDAPYA